MEKVFPLVGVSHLSQLLGDLMPQHPGSRHGSHLGGDVIRSRQRTQTALFPHSHNRTHLVPKRKQGPIIQLEIFKTVSFSVQFDVDIAGGTGAGFTLFNNTTGLAVAVIDAINGTPEEIIVSFAAQTVGDSMTVTYKPSAWTSAVGDVNGFIFTGDVT